MCLIGTNSKVSIDTGILSLRDLSQLKKGKNWRKEILIG